MWLTKHRSLSMAIGIAIGGAIVFVVAVVPIYQNADKLLGKVKTKSIELDNLTKKVSILTKLDPVVLQERVEVLDSALPAKKDVLLYLTSIDSLSRELGLTFGGLSLSPGELTVATGSADKASKTLGLQSLDTEIKMTGTDDSVYTFLRTIEGVLPLMQIKNIKVSVIGTDQYSLALTLGMLWASPEVGDIKGPVTLFGEAEDKYFNQLAEYRRFDEKIVAPINQEGKKDLFAPFSVESVVIPQQ